MPHTNSTKSNLPKCLEAFVLSIRPSAVALFSCAHCRNACHPMHGHITCPKKRSCGTTHSRTGPTPESTLRRYHNSCVCVWRCLLHLQIDYIGFHHTLCEHLASSAAAHVEAGVDEIFGLSSSSSLFLLLTTDREILTKKMQTIKPQPADAAP